MSFYGDDYEVLSKVWKPYGFEDCWQFLYILLYEMWIQNGGFKGLCNVKEEYIF